MTSTETKHSYVSAEPSSPSARPLEEWSALELLEEVRQLRAAITIYRYVVSLTRPNSKRVGSIPVRVQ